MHPLWKHRDDLEVGCMAQKRIFIFGETVMRFDLTIA